MVWRHKALTRLVWIGLDPQLSDPFGLKVGAQIPSRISECRIVEGINHTLIRLVWTRAFGPFGLTLDRENGLPIFYINRPLVELGSCTQRFKSLEMIANDAFSTRFDNVSYQLVEPRKNVLRPFGPKRTPLEPAPHNYVEPTDASNGHSCHG